MSTPRSGTVIQRLLIFIRHEPLVHFVLGALLIMAVHSAWRALARPKIVVDPAVIEASALWIENDPSRAGEVAERKELAQAWVRDELFYREGLAKGMIADPGVRAQIVEQMRRSLEPVEASPSDEQLEAFRQENPEQYRFPASVSFEHVSYHLGQESAIPPGLLARLNAGESADGFGQPVRLSNPLAPTYRPQLELLLGKPASESIFNAKTGVWFGPVYSTRGIHFIRVTQFVPPTDIPFSQVRPTLETNWLRARQRQALEDELDVLRRKYEIVMPEGWEESP